MTTSDADATFLGGDQDRLPSSISIGRWNSDGLGDFLTCSPTNNSCWLFLGASTMGRNGTAGAPAVTFVGPGSGWGYTGSFIGDVNGDTLDDIAIGFPDDLGFNGSIYAGSVYVFLSRGDGWTGTLSYTQADTRIRSASAYDYLGTAISAAGDIDNDGFADFWVAAPGHVVGTSGLGAVYLFGGNSSLLPALNLSSAALQILGTQNGGQFGATLLGGNDLDGDGKPDLAASAWNAQDGSTSIVGAVFVFNGTTLVNRTTLNWTDADLSIWGNRIGQHLGKDLSFAHNLSVSSPRMLLTGNSADPYSGGGSVLGFNTGNLTCCQNRSASSPALFFYGAETGEGAGASVAVGDIDGDGRPDLVIGAPLRDASSIFDSGAAYLVTGGPFGSAPTSVAAPNFSFQGGATAIEFGIRVAATDVNGDGYDDLLIGADREGTNGFNSGAVFLFLGRPPNRAPDGQILVSGSLFEGENITFNFAGTDPDGDALSWAWNLSGGAGYSAFPNATNASASFADNGVKVITVRVSDGQLSVIVSITITLLNVDPTCALVLTTTPAEGILQAVNATVSDRGSADVLSTNWTGPSGFLATPTSAMFTPPRGGNFSFYLSVTDGDGGAGDCSLRMDVPNESPLVSISGPASGLEGERLDFTTGISDPGSPPYEQLEWRLDGLVVASSVGFSHLFLAPGFYNLTAAAVDVDGGGGYAMILVNITDRPPDVELVLPGEMQEGGSISASVRQLSGDSYDRLSAVWAACVQGVADGLNWTAARVAPGEVCVVVTVTDDDGSAVILNGTVRVVDLRPLAGIRVTPGSALDEGNPFTLVAELGGWETADSIMFSWFLNGTPLGSGNNMTWVGQVGNWTVNVVARELGGAESNLSATLEVRNVPPSIVVAGPDSLASGQVGTWRATATDASGDPPAIEWMVDGVRAGEGTSLTLSWIRGGAHNISARATDAQGASASAARQVNVDPPLPSGRVIDAPGAALWILVAAAAFAAVLVVIRRRGKPHNEE